MAIDVHKKVEELTANVSIVTDKVVIMERQMGEIYKALVGDKPLGINGIVQRIEILEGKSEKREAKENWLYGYMVGIGFVVTLAIQYLKSKFF